MLKALLIGNPASAAGNRLAGIDLPGQWIQDLASLDPDECLEMDLVAIFGGDGTVQRTLSQLLNTLSPWQLPPIAVLPFGTTNMTAANLNLVRSRKAAVAQLREMIEHEQLIMQKRSMVRVQRDTSVDYGFFFGLGMIATVVAAWNSNRKQGAAVNQLRSLWAMFQGLRTADSATRLIVDDQEHSVYAFFATTLDRLLFGARPYWGSTGSGDLRCTWIDTNTPGLLKQAPALLRGSPRMAEQPGFHSTRLPCTQLKFPGSYILDGEIYASQSGALSLAFSAPIRWITL